MTRQIRIEGPNLPNYLEDLKGYCEIIGLKITALNGQGNGRGRPRVDVAVQNVLNAYQQAKTVRGAARMLGISSGTCWRRLKEAGM